MVNDEGCSAGAVIVSVPRAISTSRTFSVEDGRKAAEIRLGQGQKMVRYAIRKLRAINPLSAISQTSARASQPRRKAFAGPLRHLCQPP